MPEYVKIKVRSPREREMVEEALCDYYDKKRQEFLREGSTRADVLEKSLAFGLYNQIKGDKS